MTLYHEICVKSYFGHFEMCIILKLEPQLIVWYPRADRQLRLKTVWYSRADRQLRLKTVWYSKADRQLRLKTVWYPRAD